MGNELTELVDTVEHIKGVRAKKYNLYALTEAGVDEANEYQGHGLEWQILDYLNKFGRKTSTEIADWLGIEDKKVTSALETLIAKKRVKKV